MTDQEKIEKILRKKPKHRDDEDLEFLYQQMKDLAFLRNIGDKDTIKQVLGVLKI